jgi:uncharacterized coiled-coil DUF342 family protein
MIKNLYIVVISIVATYYAFFKEYGKETNDFKPNQTQLIKSIDTLIKHINEKSDSMKMTINDSDKEVEKSINNATNTITSLKSEVSILKDVVKKKNNEINGLKKIITDFGTNINEKFDLFAVPKKDRQ